jgi:hypothetical protein
MLNRHVLGAFRELQARFMSINTAYPTMMISECMATENVCQIALDVLGVPDVIIRPPVCWLGMLNSLLLHAKEIALTAQVSVAK